MGVVRPFIRGIHKRLSMPHPDYARQQLSVSLTGLLTRSQPFVIAVVGMWLPVFHPRRRRTSALQNRAIIVCNCRRSALATPQG